MPAQIDAGSVLSSGLLYPKIHAALLKVAEVKGQIDPTRLGNWLRDNNNAIVLDLKLTVDRSDKARPKWVIDHRTPSWRPYSRRLAFWAW